MKRQPLLVEQLIKREFGQRTYAKGNPLIVPVGFQPTLEIRRVDDFDDRPSRSGEFDQFGLFRPLIPRMYAQTIQPATPGQKSFADRMKSSQPDR